VVTGSFSSTYSDTESDEGVLYLSCCYSMYFFQSVFELLLLLLDKTVLDFLYFTLCFRRIFLISAEWLILYTSFMSFIRMPAAASIRNDHQAENPKLKDRGFADAILTICFSTWLC
jgi:hypothetical protein